MTLNQIREILREIKTTDPILVVEAHNFIAEFKGQLYRTLVNHTYENKIKLLKMTGDYTKEDFE